MKFIGRANACSARNGVQNSLIINTCKTMSREGERRLCGCFLLFCRIKMVFKDGLGLLKPGSLIQTVFSYGFIENEPMHPRLFVFLGKSSIFPACYSILYWNRQVQQHLSSSNLIWSSSTKSLWVFMFSLGTVLLGACAPWNYLTQSGLAMFVNSNWSFQDSTIIEACSSCPWCLWLKFIPPSQLFKIFVLRIRDIAISLGCHYSCSNNKLPRFQHILVKKDNMQHKRFILRLVRIQICRFRTFSK